MMKYLVIIMVLVAAYFVFFNDPYPKKVTFQGVQLDSRQDNNDSLHNEIDIFSYRDGSNHHILLFAILNDTPSVSIEAITNQYLNNFKSQGLVFKNQGSRHLGVRGDTVMYMTMAKNINAFIAYTEKDGAVPESVEEASSTFSELENFTF